MGLQVCPTNLNDPNNDYNYCASFGAAIFFTIIFFFLLVAHIFLAFHYRKRFSWVIAMAAAWETAGFAFRTASTTNQTSTAYGIPSSLLILLSPLWVNAFAYMVLGRIVHYFLPGEKVMGLQPKRLALVFVLLDIVSFLVQGIGGSMISNTGSPSSIMLGIHIYMGGIGLQELFIIIFSGLAINFHRKVNRVGTIRQESWKQLLLILYITLGLITVSFFVPTCCFLIITTNPSY
jgi:hypothetical protein